ncbi:hypothetical protein NL676_001346 [Syzygium grande]|nr:hypothetical protein NL676_001346 [Syzygium grande]
MAHVIPTRLTAPRRERTAFAEQTMRVWYGVCVAACFKWYAWRSRVGFQVVVVEVCDLNLITTLVAAMGCERWSLVAVLRVLDCSKENGGANGSGGCECRESGGGVESVLFCSRSWW